MTDKKVLLAINVTEDEREQVHALARLQGYKITSDFIRDLIIDKANQVGFDLEFDVDRGGDRIKRD